MAQLQTPYPTGVWKWTGPRAAVRNDTALTDPGDDSYWPLSWGRGAGSHCCVVPACAAACSAVTSANWSGWGWNDTCAFALLLVDLAVLIEHSSWGPRRL
jgi:hypothetical protein